MKDLEKAISCFDTIQKSCLVMDEAIFDFLSFYDLEKGRKDISKLRAVKKPVIRNGKLFYETVYVDPDKDNKDKEPAYSKEYKNSKKDKEKKYTGTTRIESTEFNLGDQVEFVLKNGEKAVGTFRHLAINRLNPEPFAMIRYGDKTISRRPQDLKNLTNSEQKKKQQDSPIKEGDRVQFERLYKVNGVTKRVLVEGVVTRFVKDTSSGQVIYVKTEDGKNIERFLHNVTKTDNANSDLTKEQKILLNKTINRLASSNRSNHDLISFYEKSKVKDKEEKVSKIREEIDQNNENIKKYLEVFEGKINFEDIVIEKEQKVLTQPQKEEVKEDEPVIEEEKEEQEPEYKNEVESLERKILASKINIVRDGGKDDYTAQRNVYVAKKLMRENFENLISLKKKHGSQLSEQDKEFMSSSKEELIKPERPKISEQERESSKPLKTITTVKNEDVYEKKIKEVEGYIKRAEQILSKEDTKKKLIDRYEKEIAQLSTSKNKTDVLLSKERIEKDIEKVRIGDFKRISNLNVNQRISDSKITEEEKKRLRILFSNAIKEGVIKRNKTIAGFNKATDWIISLKDEVSKMKQ